METVIEINNIDYEIGTNSILEDVSFSVFQGDYLAIIGPNGGGKTTLLKIILGLLRPDRGQIRLFGVDADKLKDRFRLGYVPQQISKSELYFPATVMEVVKSGRTARAGLFKRFEKQDLEAVNQALEHTGMSNFKNRMISDLSGGERQRILIARALAGKPELLILDEPVFGVDPGSKESFYQLLSNLNKEQSITIVFVSHDIGVISKEARNILCLNRKLVSHGSPDNFIKDEFLETLYGNKVSSILHFH